MLRLICSVGLALSVAGGAQAQNTRTTCGWQSGLWVCETSQPRPRIQVFPTDGIGDRGQKSFEDTNRNIQEMINRREQIQAQRREQEQAQQDADARFQAQESARQVAEARTKAEAQNTTVDQRLAFERQKLEAIDIVKKYISAGHCDDARRVAYEFFGTKGAQDATELCPD